MSTESEWLANLEKSSRELDERTASRLEGLSAEQLNWRPDGDTWSVLQQYHHILLANRPYIEILERLTQVARTRQHDYHPGFWGKLMLKMVGPEDKLRVSVPKPLIPSEEPLTLDTFSEYMAIQKRFHEVLRNLAGKDLNGKLTSPFAWFVKLKLGDALHMTERHNARHLGKANLLMDLWDFPR